MTTTPTIGVLALQGDVREHQHSLSELGAGTRLVRRAEELNDLDGLIIPGGESTTIDRLVRIFELQQPLRERITEGMPVYGSCAGMILLADEVLDGHREQQSIGGMNMAVRRNAFGRQVDSYEADLQLAGINGPPMRAVFIRAPWVERAGPEVTVLAAVNHDGREYPVAVRQGHLLATSFHPEVTSDLRVHEYFLTMVRERAR